MSNLHYETMGSGPLALLLHPVGLDGSFWADLPAKLGVDHQVVCVDTMGHGRSPDAERPGRMTYRVDDVIGLIESLDAGPALLIGVSFGGMIAQQVALARPDLVSGLVVAGCPGAMPAAARETILDRGRAAEAGGMEAVTDTTLERWFTPSFQSDPAVAQVRARLLADKPSNFAAAWEAITEHDALPRLGKLAMPALVISGEKDLATPIEASQALADAIPDADLVVLEGAPHIMQIECADAFQAAISDFIAKRMKAAR